MPLTAATPTPPRFEHHTGAGPVLGTGARAPRLSWQLSPTESAELPPDFRQDGYEIEMTRAGQSPQRFRVDSPDQVLVPWPGPPLTSRESATVRVRVRSGETWTDWSDPATVETGLLAPADWRARFVSPQGIGGLDRPAPILRGTLTVPAEVVRARLYATAHGCYRAELNGQPVTDEVLAPGWTSYRHRLRYQTYDVTGLLRPGDNQLAVLLGNGWHRGRLGFLGERARYGDRLALLAQLEVTTADGAVHVLATDGSWTAYESEVLADDLYDGQRTDLRLATRTAPEGPVEEVPGDLDALVAPEGPPVRVTQTLPAEQVFRSPSGATLVDFGQNLVGWVRLRVRGHQSGHEIVVRHAEVLEDGELGVRPLRTARATDSYLLAGPDEVVLEPTLTCHGFRYAEVIGVTELSADDITAVVLGSDLRRTGWFESSEPLLDRFHENVVWSARGNFLDLPTDCPQRDERLGWTGDIQVFSPSASFLFDAAGFLSSWLADLAADQYPDGTVPFVVPDILPFSQPAAAWGDAATIVPWQLYQRTGDLGLLARQLPSMRAWVDRVAALAGPRRVWAGGFQFGDWLDPTAPPDAPFQARTDPDVIATAHLARSASIVAEAAELLGEPDVAARYAELAAEVREAFVAEYLTPGGRVLSDTPTAYALALVWDLMPQALRARAGARLADLVRRAGFRISTGFVGTPLVADALTDTGHVDVAYRLLAQTGCPSWLYPVTMGATTVWERWDSMLPDGSINPGEMTSFNHYALGAVADWLHRRVAGLAPAASGYRELLVRPVPGRWLQSAGARHLTPYGEAAVDWERGDGQLTLRVRVPVGTHATVHVPGAPDPVRVGHGAHEWRVADPTPAAPALSSAATVRDLMDHEPGWTQFVAAAVAAGVATDEPGVAAALGRYLDRPAEAAVAALTWGGGRPGGEALRDCLGQLLGSAEGEDAPAA
ncbi:glycoside hydrolase family 78 protein [Natronosporangium hydrolyticum]|uniref:alpha-L-rhamnosidase n=1 Tax=Natronosporangium hydrolyticum TaxID=2811111 RepID=A0A895YGP9_9ACTN|nr:glycoside hydrolase family 78 protein [Natronosporangium hydrolyticum]QSB12868.1 glycoside hydrolase family 78 protein [Natronosporangium hydrolyticum]